MATDFDEFLALATELADTSRRILSAAYAERPETEIKADKSLVTEIDRRIEDRLRKMIHARYPDHGLVGEEAGSENPDAEHVWVLDPIDGTAGFIAGLPVFGTLIALMADDTPVLGVIDLPVTEDRWVGVRGLPTTRNGHPARCRSCPDLGQALMAASNPDFFSDVERPAFERVRSRTQWRIYGGSCFSYGLLASGRIDIAVDAGLDIFDIAALVPVIEGAGGIITDWDGRGITLTSHGCVVAAGDRRLHAAALDLLQGGNR